jgi:hypothetical protein
MISQTVWNKCVRFFVHIGIEVSYKILWLKNTKRGPNFVQFTLLSIGVFIKNTLGPLGVNVNYCEFELQKM